MSSEKAEKFAIKRKKRREFFRAEARLSNSRKNKLELQIFKHFAA